MLRRSSLLALATVAALSVAVAQTRSPASIAKSTLVKVESQLLIKAAPSRVWQVLTTTEGLGALSGMKGLEAGKTVGKVGDNYPGTVGTDAGTGVLVHVVKEKELRAAFEPANGAYLCQIRVGLESGASNGTNLTVTERYSDDSKDTLDKTAAEVAAKLAEQIEAFRVMVEMP